MAKYEMNGLNWAREPPEAGEMNDMTLLFWHRICNSSPGGLRPSTLPLDHGGFPQYWIFTSGRGRNILFLSNLKSGARTRDLPRFSQAGSFNHCTRGPAITDVVLYSSKLFLTHCQHQPSTLLLILLINTPMKSRYFFQIIPWSSCS